MKTIFYYNASKTFLIKLKIVKAILGLIIASCIDKTESIDQAENNLKTSNTFSTVTKNNPTEIASTDVAIYSDQSLYLWSMPLKKKLNYF